MSKETTVSIDSDGCGPQGKAVAVNADPRPWEDNYSIELGE